MNLYSDIINTVLIKKIKENTIEGIRHVALVITPGKVYTGENFSLGKNNRGIHAEENVISKLKPGVSKKLIKSTIIVFRVSKTGKLNNSKPCSHCLYHISTIAPKKGYLIDNIIYSTNDGNFECKKLKELINSNDCKVSSYYKNIRKYKK